MQQRRQQQQQRQQQQRRRLEPTEETKNGLARERLLRGQASEARKQEGGAADNAVDDDSGGDDGGSLEVAALLHEWREVGSLSRLMLAMEIDAAKRYWQTPSGGGVYPPSFTAKMAGVVGATDVSARTWFGGEPEYSHCINMLPFTPATEALLSAAFVAEEWPVLEDSLKRRGVASVGVGAGDGKDPSVQTQWAGFIYEDEAVIDPQAAWTHLMHLFSPPTSAGGGGAGAAVDAGTSLSAMLYWAATRPAPLAT
mmetsp:Transcript_11830/g.20096  ORF Transcript_11830/g.20096 Transcript_11830/m.20096 type:complete len:254 (-) Transcript_11830:287-1048(-)